MIASALSQSLNEPTLQLRPQPLQHIVEPVALLLTWQPVDESHPVRTRRVVARIDRQADMADMVSFRYLRNTEDFDAAADAGFKGHPAFKLTTQTARSLTNDQGSDGQVFKTGVLETFLRRLPPRKREDFPAFLAMHRLPTPFEHSDFALLGYTGAKLPSDGFAIVPVFEADQVPCELILEVAGFRHEPNADVSSVHPGDDVALVAEDNNPHDTNAVAIFHTATSNPDCRSERFGYRIGYINRALTSIVRTWVKDREVTAKIERVNGKPHRPLVYIRVSVC